jgi:hypothetical protein
MAGGTANSSDPFTKSKRQTYEGFTRLVFFGTIVVVIIAVVVVKLVTLT